MQPLTQGESAAIRRSLASFLGRVDMTGCHFLKSLIDKDEQFAWLTLGGTPDERITAELDALLIAASAQSLMAILIFPDLRSAEQLVELLRLLSKGPRWTCRRKKWKQHERDDVLVELQWKSDADPPSSVIGLAPLGSMPATRRAPFFAMALWPGPPSNEFHTKRSRVTSIGDMPPPDVASKEAYDHLVATTQTRVQAITAVPPEGAAQRGVSFCLPASVAASLESFLPPIPAAHVPETG